MEHNHSISIGNTKCSRGSEIYIRANNFHGISKMLGLEFRIPLVYIMQYVFMKMYSRQAENVNVSPSYLRTYWRYVAQVLYLKYKLMSYFLKYISLYEYKMRTHRLIARFVSKPLKFNIMWRSHGKLFIIGHELSYIYPDLMNQKSAIWKPQPAVLTTGSSKHMCLTTAISNLLTSRK